MMNLHKRSRSQLGGAGIGFLAGLMSWIAFELIFMLSMLWLDHVKVLPQGDMSGYQQLPWALFVIGMPVFFVYAAIRVGSAVEYHTLRYNGVFDSVLGIIAGSIIAVFVLMMIVSIAIIIVSIWIGCIFMGIVAVSAVTMKD